MKFFHGFSLLNEEMFFTPFVQESTYSVYGFSYGAIKALSYTQQQVAAFQRVDKLILLSPAFFQTKSERFKQLQLRGFKKNPKNYLDNFIQACFAPYPMQDVTLQCGTKEELEELLYYVWDSAAIERLQQSGVSVEVYLGGEDRIIDPQGAFEFFSSLCDVTLIQDANHFLQSH